MPEDQNGLEESGQSVDNEMYDNDPGETEQKCEEKTWIEVELLYDDGTPVDDFKFEYSITSSDGKKAEGALGTDGVASLENIEPGPCEVAFTITESSG